MRRSLPPEVFYSYVLPDMLSEHLHRYLLDSESPEWNPFYTLPLVSRHFRASCRTLCVHIFGLDENEGGTVIKHILNFTKSVWDQANLPPGRAQPADLYTYKQLMSSNSLIQVYLCAALAKCFLNYDVLWHIDLEKRWIAGELNDVDEEDIAAHEGAFGSSTTRRFKMRDDTMHRVYLPFTCALMLCDLVQPERVAYIAANYLASIVPLYATAPVMLKYTQDLETYISRQYVLELKTWVDWTYQTLKHIQGMDKLLSNMRRRGKLVKSFRPSASVPLEVIDDTNVVAVLDDIAAAEWGPDTDDIRESAIKVRDYLLEPYASNEEGDH
ncbi:hypothetical protein JB92DRAFT_2938582 [Gautieria morchelliformis]|nr:hypothetical protein JB92DRAFT_2938582 [Gautieria morchelliformis]